MALSTIVRTKVSSNSTIDLEDKRNILIAYVMGFGSIPNITDTSLGVMISDISHRMNITFKNKTFLMEVSLSPEETKKYIAGFRRILSILGGGEILCSTEYDDLTPLIEKEVVTGLNNYEQILHNNMEDLEKFLERPFDDKDFLKNVSWNIELENKYVEAVEAIDNWFYNSKIPFEQTIKYLVYKLNMENLLLFALKEGAKDAKDVVDNLEDYYSDYKTYLGRFDQKIFEAMKKGLGNLQHLYSKETKSKKTKKTA